MEKRDIELLEGCLERKDLYELKKETLIKLKNNYMLALQLLRIHQLCEDYMKKFPEEEIEGKEVQEAVTEVEKELEK